MCGIAGVYQPGGENQRRLEVRRMLARLAKRGPDDEGLWSDQHAPLTFGHRRLSIIDTSAAGHEPMTFANSRYVLTFNGEIYNFVELRDELKAHGHSFRSTTDAEVLLAGYAEWGTGVLDRLVGMFALGIWDARDQVLLLARDRVGEKPLYYAQNGSKLAFASTLTALREVPWVDTSLDQTAVAQYLQYGYVPSPLSAYAGVKKLPPANYLVFKGQAAVVEPYWDPLPAALGPRTECSEEEAIEELDELLTRAVRQQMVADVPVGAFLSGGVDSTMIVALMTQLSGHVKTFTIGFDEANFDESRHAQAVADHLGTDHVTRQLSMSEALKLIDQLPTDFGEPFADPSALPTRLVSETARSSVTVSLSGDGGDELFGGYSVYERLRRVQRVTNLARPFKRNLLPVAGNLPGGVGRRARRLLDYVETGPSLSYRRYFTTAEVSQMMGLPSIEPGLIDRAWEATSSLATVRRAMFTDLRAYLPEDVLTKVDRAAMSVSLETRAPVLDHRVIEWALKLPDSLVVEKRILKRLLARKVPLSLFDRPKQGFDVPVARWLRGDLRQSMLDEMTPASLVDVGIVDSATILSMTREHLSNRSDYGRWLWLVYSLLRWYRGQHDSLEELVA